MTHPALSPGFPDLFTHVIAWAAPAIAYLAAWLTNSRLRSERGLLIAKDLRTDYEGVTRLTLENIGARGATRIRVAEGERTLATIDGLAASAASLVRLAAAPSDGSTVAITWRDPTGARHARRMKFKRQGRDWLVSDWS